MSSKSALKSFYDKALICFIDSPQEPLSKNKNLYIITAWNPYSTIRALKLNEVANLQLQQDLTDRKLIIGRCIGGSVDGSWQESCFWVVATNEQDMIKLGDKYHQHAIYKMKNWNRLELIWCT